MYWCAREGNEKLCRFLLEHKADVNIQDESGCTPLYWCASEGNENLCRLLLEQNVDVNIQNKSRRTPLHCCARKGNENLCRLLLEHNADVNIQDKGGRTPLHWCVRAGNEHLYRLLLDNNADVNIQDILGHTILDLCAGRRNAENLRRLLLEHNAMQRHPKFELSSGQKAIETEYTAGVASVQGAEKLKSNLKSEKTLRQNRSYTHTTLELEERSKIPFSYRTKELMEELEAEQVKTQGVRHAKSKATTSSRTNKCVMA